MPRKKKMPSMPYEFHSKIAGVTFKNEDGSDRQMLIRAYAKPGIVLTMKREPTNPFDANAIGVWIEAKALLRPTTLVQIGHITSRAASELAPIMDAGGRVWGRITTLTGGERGDSVGANIEISVEPPKAIRVDTSSCM